MLELLTGLHVVLPALPASLQREMEGMYSESEQRHAGIAAELDRRAGAAWQRHTFSLYQRGCRRLLQKGAFCYRQLPFS
jgi:hypothetical protein